MFPCVTQKFYLFPLLCKSQTCNIPTDGTEHFCVHVTRLSPIMSAYIFLCVVGKWSSPKAITMRFINVLMFSFVLYFHALVYSARVSQISPTLCSSLLHFRMLCLLKNNWNLRSDIYFLVANVGPVRVIDVPLAAEEELLSSRGTLLLIWLQRNCQASSDCFYRLLPSKPGHKFANHKAARAS